MTIIKRNRLIRRIANILAERDGREALEHHKVEVTEQPEGRHFTLCCEHAYEEAARNTYHHLTTRRAYQAPATGRVHLPVGLPALQRMLAPVDPPRGWVGRAVQRAKDAGMLVKTPA